MNLTIPRNSINRSFLNRSTRLLSHHQCHSYNYYSTTTATSSSSTASKPPITNKPKATTSPSPKSPPPKRRALVDLGLISAGVLSLGGTILWLKSKNQLKKSDESYNLLTGNSDLESSRPQFEIPISSHTGSPGAKKVLTMLSTDEVNKLLKKYETTFSLDRIGNPVFRYDTNHVASNSPIEDDSICALTSRDQIGVPPKSGSGDMMFFGVFDGHSGWQTSKLLVESLVPSVNRELSAVFRGEPEYVAAHLAKEITSSPPGKYPGGGPLKPNHHQEGMMEKIWGFITLNQKKRPILINYLDQDDELVKLAIQNAFVKLDKEIVSRPMKMLEKYDAQMKKGGGQPLPRSYGSELTPQHTESLQTLLPSLSGSCALLAYIDTLRSKVHVACTGDSRAVMGVWEPKANWGRGKWKGLVLSEDQEGTNPNEVKRMQSEHPESEKENVIRRGRVLGGLQPTRAFGDARYKWPPGISERLYEAFHPSGRSRTDPPDYRTPPYVTAKPEVSSASLPNLNETDKPAFIVLATDGLWDRLETSEVVGLVGTWIEENNEIIRSNQIEENHNHKKKVLKKDHVAGSSRVEVIDPISAGNTTGGDRNLAKAHDPSGGSKGTDEDRSKAFTFEDFNVSTHLIRNALGGSSKEKIGALLSIPSPHSRRYRDDITVTVIFIDPKKVSVENNNNKRDEKDQLQKKLGINGKDNGQGMRISKL